MKTRTYVNRLGCIGLFTLGMGLAWLPVAEAQVPPLLNYQGRLIVGGTNYHGTAPFKFALVDGTGTTTYWSNDGSSAGGREPSAAVALEVSKGLYSVLLGDSTLPNMTPIPSSVFGHNDVRLRVWVQEGGPPFQQLTPDPRVAAVGYALMAANVADGSVTASKLSVGAVGAAQLADGAVTSAKLASNAASLGKVSGGALEVVQTTNVAAVGRLNAFRFAGDGSGLSNVLVAAVNVTGKLGVGQLPANVLTNGGGASGELSAALNSHTTASGFGTTAMGHFTEASGWASVSMGHATKASNETAVAMGFGTTAGGAESTAMGFLTTASGAASTAMGVNTTASGPYSTAMGSGSTASGETSTAMGRDTAAGGLYSTAMGYRAKALHNGSLVWADAQDADFSSTAANQFLVRAGGGVGINTTTPQSALHVAGTITATGNLALPASASAGEGAITIAGIPALHMHGSGNSFAGGSGNFTMSGEWNTATGRLALENNTAGSQNTATGNRALRNNTTGTNNTANGWRALIANTTGRDNTATGSFALDNNTTGNDNTGFGSWALASNMTGSSNIALGYGAGSSLTSGNNNILIGNSGVGSESGTIRLGTVGTQTRTFIAGISGATIPTGVTVLVAANGQLGALTSSARFKQNIKGMGAASDVVLELRPVTFTYRADIDPAGVEQFGLVAEEVEKVAPELVLHDVSGAPYTVRYDAVNAMLLNEFQKQHRKVKEQEQILAELESANVTLEARLSALETRLQELLERRPEEGPPRSRAVAASPSTLR